MKRIALMLTGLALLAFMAPLAYSCTPGKVTGGGQIALSPIAGSFGFNIMYKLGDTVPKGDLEYIDHETGMNVHAHDMTLLDVWDHNTKAGFWGTCTIDGVSGFTFHVYVEDNGEPGKNDFFKIWLYNGVNIIYSAGGTLLNGNIQIHKTP